MLVAGPQRRLFLASLALGAGSLLMLDLHFAPEALPGPNPVVIPVADPASTTVPDNAEPSAAPAPSTAASPSSPSPSPSPSPQRLGIPAAARVPTIVATFDSQAREPADLSGVRALATAMIEDHDVTVVLEGHTDTFGGEDFNQTISLARAEWVKSRVVALGVSPERIQTVGLGATRPLRSDAPDAQAMNRRVEVRWLGR
jgi:outer membrane protein OmpA-like peptidoglycan-associated protein